MATVRIRISLFPKQDRIPFDMLMDAMSNAAQMLVEIARDMGLPSAIGDWVSEDIKGGSLSTDQVYKEDVPLILATRIQRGFRAAWDPSFADGDVRPLIKPETWRSINTVKEQLGPRGEIRLGFYEHVGGGPSLWVDSLGQIVEPEGIMRAVPETAKSIRYFGELKGTIESIYVSQTPPYLKFKPDGSTRQVTVTYNEDAHGELVESLKDRGGKVVVEGFITEDKETHRPSLIEAKHFHALPRFQWSIYSKFEDSVEGITGGMNAQQAQDFLRKGDADA